MSHCPHHHTSMETDEIIKYDNIIKFHDNYCRNYSKINDEDPNWFYCKNSEGSNC